MMRGKADDLVLEAGDILVIPTNKGKRFAMRAVEIAISAGLIIGTYAVMQ